MYTPSHFDEQRIPILHGLMRQHPLAAVVGATEDGVVANHIPLMLDPQGEANGILRGHIARANPMWKQLPSDTSVLAIFQGVSHYISPQTYPSKQQDARVVPTWNYVVVHAHGRIRWFNEAARLRGLLEAMTDIHENSYEKPWRMSDAPEEFIRRMLDAIVGFEIPITRISGKWKLSQNRSALDRAGVATALAEHATEAAREMASLVATSGSAPNR